MDSHFASAGGCIGNTGMALAPASVAVTVGVSVNGRYNPVSYQKSASCNAYDPYAGGNVDVRTPSVYPYDADVEYKEQDLGRSKINHLQMAGTNPAYITKVQQQPSYNYNSCYNNYNQNTCVLPQNNSNYYPYSYEQHYHYQQQQQHNQQQQQQQQQSQPQHQQNFHQNPTLQHPQYKYGVKNIGPPQQYQHLQQQQRQLPNFVMNTGNTMKMSPPEYGQPSYSHIKHPYHNTSYHHPPSQKGGTDIMRPGLDTGMLPYVNNKMVNSTISPATHSPQYPSNYSYQPHNYPSSLPPGHHTYQNQNACDDNRWVWSNGNSNEFSTTCRSSCPAYMNGSTVKQNNMWPSVPMQYQQALSGGYSATGTATNQNCCTQPQSAGHYYPQQYPKYPVQSMPNSVEFNSNRNDLYNNIQDKSICNESAPVTSSAKAYTDLSSQNQTSAYQIINSSSMSYNNTDDCHSLTPPDYNSRYLQQQPHQYYHPFQQQQQQQSKKSPSPSLSTSTYTHYYHNPYPFSRQSYAIPEPQPELYTEQQIDNKTSITTKSQNLRDFLTSWNEDEDECTDRSNINSSEMPYIETLHGADNFTPSQDQAHIATMSPIIENHLQFKGSFTSRPKIHVGITVDSTVESDQYINLPDIIIDIEKSNKDVVSMTEDVIIDNIPKPEKPESLNKDESEELMPKVSTPKTTIGQAKNLIRDYPHLKRLNQLRRRRMVLQRNRRSIITNKRNCRNKNYQRIPSSLKTLCLSLINSDKFRSRFQELNGIDIFNNPPTITDNAVRLDDSAILQPMTLSTDNIPPTNDNDKDISKYNNNNNNSPSISLIPKLSDLCKNALNSSFDRDVLVINIDEFLDSDNLYVVQCDINENIVETYVDEEFQPQQQQHQQELHQQHNSNNSVSDNVIENFNDNNNNYNSTSSNNNYTQSNNNQTTDNNYTLTTPTNRLGLLKRCHSISEVSNLPLHNALMRSDNLNSNTKYTPPSPSSDSCPASLDCTPLPSLINTNCSTLSQISLDQGQFHEMLILTGIVNDATNTDFEDPSSQIISHTSDDNDDLLLLSPCPVSTPSIHHEEIVPDNLKRFQKEKFFKYLHAKYVQRNLSQFYHANRIIKKYRKYLIKNILNIVR